jgi:hypothetical protein
MGVNAVPALSPSAKCCLQGSADSGRPAAGLCPHFLGFFHTVQRSSFNTHLLAGQVVGRLIFTSQIQQNRHRPRCHTHLRTNGALSDRSTRERAENVGKHWPDWRRVFAPLQPATTTNRAGATQQYSWNRWRRGGELRTQLPVSIRGVTGQAP